MHDRTARSFTSTVHAPHAEIPQPNFVPVMPRVSRSAHNSGVSGSRSSVCARPLMVTEMAIVISHSKSSAGLQACPQSGPAAFAPAGASARLAGAFGIGGKVRTTSFQRLELGLRTCRQRIPIDVQIHRDGPVPTHQTDQIDDTALAEQFVRRVERRITHLYFLEHLHRAVIARS